VVDESYLPPPSAAPSVPVDPYPLDTAIANFFAPITQPLNQFLQRHVPINVQVGSYAFHANPTVGQLAIPVLAVGTIFAPEVFAEADAEVAGGAGLSAAGEEAAAGTTVEASALRAASEASYTAEGEAVTLNAMRISDGVRIKNDAMTVYTGFLFLEIISFIGTTANFSLALLFRGLFVSVVFFVVAIGLVLLVHSVAALMIVWSDAMRAHMSMRDYLNSPQYQEKGKLRLRRGAGRAIHFFRNK
jgi:hypothetical protein